MDAVMTKTVLKKLNIKKFRALNNVEIEFGTDITLICGKNGTSKSSILGIAAQIFSFGRDYTKNPRDQTLKYRTITGVQFKSKYSEHFRISDKFDLPGSIEVYIELFDGYTGEAATAELALSKRIKETRPVVRNNSTAAEGNASRNFTHPVLYLSLKRLYPITDRDYKVCDFEHHKDEFIALTNELLNRTASTATRTTGTIHSGVAHGNNYDQDSVSAGEDNAGQLILTLLSFRQLKKDYPDYKGGLLLIDEADAALFPAAQIKLIEILQRECPKLNLQVIITSHSPTLIEYIYEKSQQFQKRYKTLYLSDTYGSIQVMDNKSWPKINADLHTKTIAADTDLSLPRINVYFEDKEAIDLFKKVMSYHPANKFLKLLDISLGCTNYIQLIKKRVIEFSIKSIICLDADVDKTEIEKYPSIVCLPGKLPPDQLIFEYLYNLSATHPIWENSLQFTRPVLTSITSEVIQTLGISDDKIKLKELVLKYQQNETKGKKLRDLFKSFYKNDEFQALLKLKVTHNPWHWWQKDHLSQSEDFVSRFIEQLKKTMQHGYYVDKSKLHILTKKKVRSTAAKPEEM